MRTAAFFAGMLWLTGCGWYDGLHAPGQGELVGQVQFVELGLSDEISGTVLDLDTGLTDFYAFHGECTRAVANTGWDLKVAGDRIMGFNDRTALEASNQPGARPDEVDPAAAVFGPATDRRLEDDSLVLVRTDLGAVVAVFDPVFDLDQRLVSLSTQRLAADVCDPACSPVDRPIRPGSHLRIDLSAGWILNDTGALCGTPSPEPDRGVVYDLVWAYGSMEAQTGGLEVDPRDPNRALVMTDEGLAYELAFEVDPQDRAVRVSYALVD